MVDHISASQDRRKVLGPIRIPALLLMAGLVVSLASCDSVLDPQAPAIQEGPAGATVSIVAAEGTAPDKAVSADKLADGAEELYLQDRADYGARCFGGPCYFAVDFNVPDGAFWTVTDLRIDVFFTQNTTFPGHFSYALHADDDGKPATSPFFSRFEDDTFTVDGVAHFFDVSGPDAPVLGAGTYWLVLDVVNSSAAFASAFAWYAHMPPVESPTLLSGNPASGSWGVLFFADRGGDQDQAFGIYGIDGFVPPMDIMPGSDTNPINLTSRGLLPVAVLSTETFNAAWLDPASVTLGNDDGDDTSVAMRRNGTLFASMEDVDGDGLLDLVLHFEVPALVANGDLDSTTTQLVLNGSTVDGIPVRSSDTVQIVGR
jgi:hypothetical protein